MREKIAGIKINSLIRWENTKTKLYKCRWPIYIVCFILVGVWLLRWLKNNVGAVKELSDEPALIGVIGTLLGAFVGGIFTLVGTVFINREQIRIQTKIRRKNVIYKPLYDELMEIHYKILKDNPYPSKVEFSKGAQTIRPDPQFSAWSRMKMDTRYLETPTKLREILNLLEDKMKEYNDYRKKIVGPIQSELEHVLSEIIGDDRHKWPVGEDVVSAILIGDRIELEKNKTWQYHLQTEKKDIGESDKIKITDKLLKNCTENEDIKLMRQTYADWQQIEESAISLLEAMIQNISTTCEG